MNNVVGSSFKEKFAEIRTYGSCKQCMGLIEKMQTRIFSGIQTQPMMFIIYRRKYYFGPYILRSQSICSLYFDNGQFGPQHFKFTINLVSTVKSLMENIYVTNGLYSWHI